MKGDPEQRAVQLGEYIAASTGPQCGRRQRRSGAASPPCTRMLRCGCGRWSRTCSGRCVRFWPAIRQSGICAAVRPPGANTAADKRRHTSEQNGSCAAFLFSPGCGTAQCAFFQPADLRLTDADLPRHLHLGLALEVAQLHDPLFPRGQPGHGLPELQPADPAVLAVRVAHLIDHIHGIAAIGVHRLFQADRLHHRFQRGGHLAPGKSRLPRRSRPWWARGPAAFPAFPAACMAR